MYVTGTVNNGREKSPSEQVLPAGVLLGNYEILSQLYRGSNFIAYLALHTTEHETVILREFFPVPHAERDPDSCRVVPAANVNAATAERRRKEFLQTTRKLSELKHPGILPVQQAFSALGTVYSVQPYDHSPTLAQAAPAPEFMTEGWLSPLLLQLLNALESLHSAGMLHKALSPVNILVHHDGHPVIIGPDDSRTTPPEFATDALPTLCYTPLEQLQTKLPLGPWSDLYALGAICYHLITGERPPNSIYRSYDSEPYKPLAERSELHNRFSREFLTTIDRALENLPEDRWQNPAEWVAAITGRRPPRRRGNRVWWLLLLPGLLIPAIWWLLSSMALPQEVISATILNSACSGDIETLKSSLAAGGNANATDSTGCSALNWAVYHGHSDCVQHLLDAPEIDVNAANADGYGPLFWAVYHNRTDCLQKLLAHPAINVNTKDADGLSALHWAMRCGHEATARCLLAQTTTQLNARGENERTPLHEAAAHGQTACLRLLLTTPGIDVNAQDRSGATALSTAIRYHHIECVRLLLTTPGINHKRADNFGRTPLQVAEEEGVAEIIAMLRRLN